MPYTYTAGWIKRGPSGVIGTNKKCANETVATLLADHEDGVLDREVKDSDALDALLAEQVPERVDYAGWERIDEHERARGEEQGRPRVKLCSIRELVRRSRSGDAAAV